MGCCRKKCEKPKESVLTEEQLKVLTALNEIGEPCACKDIAAATGLSSNSVSCRLRSLKGKGYVESPARCKYVITDAGRSLVSES